MEFAELLRRNVAPNVARIRLRAAYLATAPTTSLRLVSASGPAQISIQVRGDFALALAFPRFGHLRGGGSTGGLAE